MINLIIADHPVFIDGLKTTLTVAQDIHIAGEVPVGRSLQTTSPAASIVLQDHL